MSATRHPNGSEWRRWDLHVHTPFSALHNGFGDDLDAYAKQFFERAVELDIAVVGVTDYFILDGYETLKSIQSDHARLEALLGTDIATKAKSILLLPNLELRSSHLVEGHRVNFHILFSNEIPVTVIREHFFANLRFRLASDPENRDEERQLSRANLEELGRRLKEQHEPFAHLSDLVCGMQNVVISHEQALDALKAADTHFRKRYLFVVPVDEDLSSLSWNGQDHLARKTWYQKCHAYFSSNSRTRDFALGRFHESEEQCKSEFGSLKPCFHGSDAHTFEKLFVPDNDRFCWIKADPTFAGLRQTLTEPASRVFIGSRPDELLRVESDPTRYISAIELSRSATVQDDHQWFGDRLLPLNSGLVAIIGNKGGGKSALADIIAHAGRSRQSNHFSFLKKTRFLSLPAGVKAGFTATLHLRSGKELPAKLADETDHASEEIVKYIPQGYLDEICTEIKASGETQFDTELKTVIFSHVPEAKKLGEESLDELIHTTLSEKERRLSQLRDSLLDINEQIVSLGERLAPSYRTETEALLKSRNEEMEALREVKPAVVPEPEQDAGAQKELEGVNADLKNARDKWTAAVLEVRQCEDAEKRLRLKRLTAQRVRERIENFSREWDECKADLSEDLKSLEIQLTDLIKVEITLDGVRSLEQATSQEIEQIESQLDVEQEGSKAHLARKCKVAIEELEAKLDAPNRRYQEYLRAQEEWDEKVKLLNGDTEKPDSIEGAKERLRLIEEVWPKELASLRQSRQELLREIHGVLSQMVAIYEEFYKPVQEFIEQHPIAAEQGGLRFSAKIALSPGFYDRFLGSLDRSKRGSFQGKDEGDKRLKEEIQVADFTTPEGAEAFANRLEELLTTDEGDSTKPPREITSQLRSAFTEESILSLIFGLDYLEPRYELTWQGKSLEQLSPGERGNLLIVFYLLIDKRTCPLIIDQPEENLDNQTIAKMLVPCLKFAKGRRQVFVVTHNPNLAVVADADQVIHAEIDKADGNRITYTAGAIEEPIINKKIVDFLEGTKPAFDLRDAKYELFP